MYNNYNYPYGADNENAPWNQEEPKEIEVDVTASYTLSKSTTISVSDYTTEEWEDYDRGDEGEIIHNSGIDYNFSDTNFEQEYEDTCYGIPELLTIVKGWAKEKLEVSESYMEKVRLNNIIKSAEDWVVDDYCVNKD